MLNYEKLSKTNRTIGAILLLLVFMALAMADLFISFFGGLVLGVLLVQFELEVQRFLRRYLGHVPRMAGLLKRYRNLSHGQKTLLKAGIQVVVAVLLLAGLLDSFWGGLISGMLLALLTDELIRHQRKKHRARLRR